MSIQYFRSPGSSSLREVEGGKTSIARHFARRPTSFACIDDILPRDIFNDTEATEAADLTLSGRVYYLHICSWSTSFSLPLR